MSDEFYICISGPFGPTYQLDIRNNRVHYSFSTLNQITERAQLPELEYQPSQDDINNFWNVVTTLDIQNWDSEYIHPEILEGPRWEICMRSGEQEKCCLGVAAFPGSPHPTYSPVFLQLIAAARQVLGWMPFG